MAAHGADHGRIAGHRFDLLAQPGDAQVDGAIEDFAGIGAGQMNRRDSGRIATVRARESDDATRIVGSAMASDAFLPFADGIDVAIEAGASVVIQPGGAMRDQEVIDAADAAGIAMVFTGMRHFRH